MSCHLKSCMTFPILHALLVSEEFWARYHNCFKENFTVVTKLCYHQSLYWLWSCLTTDLSMMLVTFYLEWLSTKLPPVTPYVILPWMTRHSIYILVSSTHSSYSKASFATRCSHGYCNHNHCHCIGIQMNLIKLDQAEMDWNKLNWTKKWNWITLSWIELNWKVNWIKLNWIWIKLNWKELN